MQIPFVDLKKQYFSIKSEIDSAIKRVINDTAFVKGKYVKSFEREYSDLYGVKHCVSCGNGTDAIYISLKALGIGDGDEVITTSLSWISTSETISQAGAKVVFVDIDPDYYTIDTSKIEEKINYRTKAIIPVHIYGQPSNMTEVMRIAKKYDLKVIEDCAQAHFAQWKGQNVGTFGDMATFSFFPGKNLGAYGDAGCIITDNDELAEKANRFSKHGALGKHDHKIEGINSRLDGLQAAILSVKLKYINDWTNTRIQIAKNYNNLLKDEKNIITPLINNKAKHVYHLYVIRSDQRDYLIDKLTQEQISTGIHYPKALPYLEAYNYLKHLPKHFPIAHKYQSKILSLPIYPELTYKKQLFVIEQIKSKQNNNE
tara:strand:- start:17429 stop:18541 length:1113 start_codon:yes stop_codon:yes gene_type:complete